MQVAPHSTNEAFTLVVHCQRTPGCIGISMTSMRKRGGKLKVCRYAECGVPAMADIFDAELIGEPGDASLLGKQPRKRARSKTDVANCKTTSRLPSFNCHLRQP